eukprot:194764-Pelagomonas_calceolata.AAC.1
MCIGSATVHWPCHSVHRIHHCALAMPKRGCMDGSAMDHVKGMSHCALAMPKRGCTDGSAMDHVQGMSHCALAMPK